MTKIEAKKYKFLRALVASLLVVIMAGAVVLGVGFGVYGKNFDDWFKPKQDASQGEEQPEQKPDESVIIKSDDAVGMLLSYGEASVASDGSTTQTITATVEPDDATNKQVDWSIAFKDANSAWASGKDLSEYVTIEPASDGSRTATVTCKQAFAEQVIITCTSRETSDIKATATVDYAKKVVDVEVKIKEVGADGYLSSLDFVESKKSISFEYVPTYSIYTLDETFTETVQYRVAPTFYDVVNINNSYVSRLYEDYSSAKLSGLYISKVSLFEFCYYFSSDTLVKPVQKNKAYNDFAKGCIEGTDFLDFKITYTGSHSTAEFAKTIKVGKVDFTVSVTNVSLSGGLIF